MMSINKWIYSDLRLSQNVTICDPIKFIYALLLFASIRRLVDKMSNIQARFLQIT